MSERPLVPTYLGNDTANAVKHAQDTIVRLVRENKLTAVQVAEYSALCRLTKRGFQDFTKEIEK